MLNLFKIEWLKIKTYRTFWILFLSFLVLFPLTFYFSASKYMHLSRGNQQEQTLQSILGIPFVFPRVWLASSWIGGLFFVLIGMLFILLITNEVQYRTYRQNIIDGWSRIDFLKAKFSLLIFFVLVSTALVSLNALLVGMIYSSSTEGMFDEIYYIGYFALMATVYLMVAFLIAILVKRTGLSIIIYFTVVCIIDNALWLIFTFKDNQLGYFMPLEVVDTLVPNPFKPNLLERRKIENNFFLIAAAAYMFLYSYIIINYFRKTDLKT